MLNHQVCLYLVKDSSLTPTFIVKKGGGTDKNLLCYKKVRLSMGEDGEYGKNEL